LFMRTRAPKALGRQPSVASSQPAFMPSSISFAHGGHFLL
jgi:hypothetical protein